MDWIVGRNLNDPDNDLVLLVGVLPLGLVRVSPDPSPCCHILSAATQGEGASEGLRQQQPDHQPVGGVVVVVA